MEMRRWMIVVCVGFVWLTVAACSPNVANKTATVASTAETASNQVQSNQEGNVVNSTPISVSQTIEQPAGRTESGLSISTSVASGESTAPTNLVSTNRMFVYTDDTYKFSVQYPAEFVTRTLSIEKLAQLKPTPAIALIFMNPEIAASSSAELEPADLEVRAYESGTATSLKNWLIANAFLPADDSSVPKPLQTQNISGIQVCASTMIAPGCSYFVIGDGWIYQLTPATLVGESMIESFKLIP